MTDRAPTGVRSWVMEYFKLNPRTRVTLDELVEASGFSETQIRNCISGIKYQLGDRFPLETFSAPRPNGVPGAPMHVAWSYRPDASTDAGELREWMTSGAGADLAGRTESGDAPVDLPPTGDHRSADTTGDDGSGIRLIDAPEYESEGDEAELLAIAEDAKAQAEEGHGFVVADYDTLSQKAQGGTGLVESLAQMLRGEGRVLRSQELERRADRPHVYEELATTRRGEILVEDEDGDIYRLIKVKM